MFIPQLLNKNTNSINSFNNYVELVRSLVEPSVPMRIKSARILPCTILVNCHGMHRETHLFQSPVYHTLWYTFSFFINIKFWKSYGFSTQKFGNNGIPLSDLWGSTLTDRGWKLSKT